MVGFLGPADIARPNAESLLDDWFPADNDNVVAVFPDEIPRKGGLRTVYDLMSVWAIKTHQLGADKIVRSLIGSKDDGYVPYLILLHDEADEDTAGYARQAIEAGISVLALNQALDDVALTSDLEIQVTRSIERTYGQPRGAGAVADLDQAVQAEVVGPATIIGQELAQIGLPALVVEDIHRVGLLAAAINEIVRGEVRRQMLGHYAHAEPLLNEPKTETYTDVIAGEPTEVTVTHHKVKLWTDGENYHRPAEGKARAPKGMRTIEVSPEEALNLLNE